MTTLIIIWAISMAYSLLKLRKQNIPTTATALWALIIILVPFVGVIAYLLIGENQE